MNALTTAVLRQKEGEFEKWLVDGKFLKPGQRAEVSIRIVSEKVVTFVIHKGRRKCRMDDLTDELTKNDWDILLSTRFHDSRLNELVKLLHANDKEGVSVKVLKEKQLDFVQWLRDLLIARRLPFKIRAANNSANRQVSDTTVYKIYKRKSDNPA